MRTIHWITVTLAALLTACGELPFTTPGPERNELGGEPVQVTRLRADFPAYYSGLGEQARLVVKSQGEWEVVWRRMWSNHHPVPPAPPIDFDRELVLVAAMGSRATGGYAIRVTEAAALSDHVAVRVVETSPGGACVLTQAVTAPVDVVTLPRTPLPVRFRNEKAVHECR